MISRKVNSESPKLDRSPTEQIGLILNYKNELFDAAMNGDRLAAIEANQDLNGALIGLTNLLEGN